MPLSHPFVERLIGTVRRELLDQIPFWGGRDLACKLQHFKDYYNRERTHVSLAGRTPETSDANVRRRHSMSRATDGDRTAEVYFSYR